jgi:alpha-glucosidase
VSDKRNYSDGIQERYRHGRPLLPQSERSAVFDTAIGSIQFGASRMNVQLADGVPLVTTADGIGFNGEKFILNLDVGEVTGFYGFGERTKRFNKSGDSMDFWTVDVVAVFPHSYARDDYDPSYVAIPLAIIKRGDRYSGIYFDNPERAIIDVEQIDTGRLSYQSMGGNTDIYIIAGPRLRDVVRHFATLTGRNEVPPLWSLGHHQCRWGYKSEADFLGLKADFEKHDIPVSVLWYDIDYMNGYRVFTWDENDFPSPAGLNTTLKEAGIRTVTIVDPGVKLDPGYSIYDQGKDQQVFCRAASGRDYVGRVWAGDTVFPDFTQDAVQDWWAEAMAKFLRESAIDGVWLDMNDPATGYSTDDDMRFQNGTVPHAKYHNQYAHFMAKASHKAFDRLDPNARPFLLTRSACTGTQRYSAVWTGDNVSNWSHLRMSIPCTLNLGLSGERSARPSQPASRPPPSERSCPRP